MNDFTIYSPHIGQVILKAFTFRISDNRDVLFFDDKDNLIGLFKDGATVFKGVIADDDIEYKEGK